VIFSILTMIVIHFFSLSFQIISFFQLGSTCDIQLLFLTCCIIFFISLSNVRSDLLNTSSAGCHVMQCSLFDSNLSSVCWHFCSSTERLVVSRCSLAAFIVGNDWPLHVFISTYRLSIVFRCILVTFRSVVTLLYVLQVWVVRVLSLMLFWFYISQRFVLLRFIR